MGKTGCALHPRSRGQMWIEDAHEHTGTDGAIRHSLRNGLTAYAALSPETNSSCLRRFADRRRRLTRSGNLASAKLDASHGRQDHTVLPYATTSPVLRGIDRSQLSPPCDLPRAQRHRVHRNPHSTYRDDAYAPLHEAGWRKEAIVSGKDEADYFRSAGWTTQITLEWLVKFDSARAVFSTLSTPPPIEARTDLPDGQA